MASLRYLGWRDGNDSFTAPVGAPRMPSGDRRLPQARPIGFGYHVCRLTPAGDESGQAVASVRFLIPTRMAPRPRREIRSRSRVSGAVLWLALVALVAVAAGWISLMMWWNYSSGERAGWVQKFSRKGWVCKTWEGELALVTMPGTAQEKFLFTVRDDDVATKINDVMGKRVSLRYEEKVGLPTSCFGDTRYWVNGVKAVEDIPLAPGLVVPTQPAATPPAPTPPAQPAATPPVATPPAQPSQPTAEPAAK